MESPPKSKTSFGELFLRFILMMLGFLGDKPKENCVTVAFRVTRSMAILLLSFAEFLYEVCAAMEAVMSWHSEGNRIAIIGILYDINYVVRTASTFTLISAFCWKATALTSLHESLIILNETNPQANSKSRRKENRLAVVAVSVFVTFMAVNISTRLWGAFQTGSSILSWSSPPFLSVTLLQEAIFKLCALTFQEALRVLYAGYLGILLANFRANSASETLSLLDESIIKNQTSKNDLIGLWFVREAALTFAEKLEKTFGIIFSLLFVTDVLRLVCIVGDALSPQQTTPQRIRLVASVMLCLSSFLINVDGLISLMDKEKETRAHLYKLRSFWARDPLQSLDVMSNKPDTPANNDHYGVSQYQVCTVLSAFESSCFGSRKVAVAWNGLGYIGRGTVISVFGWIITFYVFLLGQH
ncbi:hypothetical protein BV898_03436 [Hypsibius exemplaris]|uniref:Gustatory receptor n=1 Tax=Hypsibius exemplaris TaxID=2072580 RepID=A0A1W0X5I8_HYPEX|nr:hypothetical protein BV898_03436 [Hypsibius exemplaris]